MTAEKLTTNASRYFMDRLRERTYLTDEEVVDFTDGLANIEIEARKAGSRAAFEILDRIRAAVASKGDVDQQAIELMRSGVPEMSAYYWAVPVVYASRAAALDFGSLARDHHPHWDEFSSEERCECGQTVDGDGEWEKHFVAEYAGRMTR